MWRIFSSPTDGVYQKFGKFWFIFALAKYIIITACLILLSLQFNLYDIHDDFTPAYPRNASTGNTTTSPLTPEPSTTSTPQTTTTSTTTTKPTSTTTKKPTTSTTKKPTTSTTKKPNKNRRSFSDMLSTPKEIPVELFERGDYPLEFRWERSPENKTVTVNYSHDYSLEDDSSDKDSMVRLSDLLIMYPCCTTIIIILGMQMCSQMLLDPMTKWTNLFLIILCIALCIVLFVVSLLAALRSAQITVIVICVLSVIFIILQVFEFILIYIA